MEVILKLFKQLPAIKINIVKIKAYINTPTLYKAKNNAKNIITKYIIN